MLKLDEVERTLQWKSFRISLSRIGPPIKWWALHVRTSWQLINNFILYVFLYIRLGLHSGVLGPKLKRQHNPTLKTEVLQVEPVKNKKFHCTSLRLWSLDVHLLFLACFKQLTFAAGLSTIGSSFCMLWQGCARSSLFAEQPTLTARRVLWLTKVSHHRPYF